MLNWDFDLVSWRWQLNCPPPLSPGTMDISLLCLLAPETGWNSIIHARSNSVTQRHRRIPRTKLTKKISPARVMKLCTYVIHSSAFLLERNADASTLKAFAECYWLMKYLCTCYSVLTLSRFSWFTPTRRLCCHMHWDEWKNIHQGRKLVVQTCTFNCSEVMSTQKREEGSCLDNTNILIGFVLRERSTLQLVSSDDLEKIRYVEALYDWLSWSSTSWNLSRLHSSSRELVCSWPWPCWWLSRSTWQWPCWSTSLPGVS